MPQMYPMNWFLFSLFIVLFYFSPLNFLFMSKNHSTSSNFLKINMFKWSW